MKIEGAWPEDATKISLHLPNASQSDAVREVAKKAGWSVVLRGDFDCGRTVSLDVEDAAPKDVLESILEEGSFVAKRRGEGGEFLEVVSHVDAKVNADEDEKAPAEESKRGPVQLPRSR